MAVTGQPSVSPAVDFAPLRWWHLPAIDRMERELFGEEAWSSEMFWSELAGEDSYYLVALAAGEPIGYGGLAVTGPDAYIQTVGVHGSAQRAGVGRRLMHALLDEAVVRQADVCWLEVRADNDAAQQLYETLGFTHRGVRRGYYQPSGVDAVVMSKPLRTTGAADAGGRR
jgi:[ribosomal protein S18]-alanine N-acetyltransferase